MVLGVMILSCGAGDRHIVLWCWWGHEIVLVLGVVRLYCGAGGSCDCIVVLGVVRLSCGAGGREIVLWCWGVMRSCCWRVI